MRDTSTHLVPPRIAHRGSGSPCATTKADAWLALQARMARDIDRWTRIFTAMQLDGYTMGSQRAAIRLPRAVGIEAGIDSFTDHDFELDMGFPAPGRSCFVNLRHVA